jgi:hypothetical protein
MAELLKIEQEEDIFYVGTINSELLLIEVNNCGETTYFQLTDKQVSTLIHTMQQYLINKIKQP